MTNTTKFYTLTYRAIQSKSSNTETSDDGMMMDYNSVSYSYDTEVSIFKHSIEWDDSTIPDLIDIKEKIIKAYDFKKEASFLNIEIPSSVNLTLCWLETDTGLKDEIDYSFNHPINRPWLNIKTELINSAIFEGQIKMPNCIFELSRKGDPQCIQKASDCRISLTYNTEKMNLKRFPSFNYSGKQIENEDKETAINDIYELLEGIETI